MQNGKRNSRVRQRGRSSTAEILGFPTRNGGIPSKWAEHYNALTELRERLLGDQVGRTEAAKVRLSTAGEHMADAATDSYDRDWALAMVSSDQNALYEIDQALKRVADGSYGICEMTGKAIEAARLRAIPWTRYCAQAQAELESRGLMNRVHLGPVGNWFNSGAEDSTQIEEESEEALREAA